MYHFCMRRHILIAAGLPLLALAANEPAVVQVDTTRTINSFDPDSALGSSLDVLSHRDIDLVFTPHILQESLSAGWGPITYRNNSELRMAAWHWNDKGAWSDAANKSGYFTGSTELKEPIRYILSYPLPHRGFTTSGDSPVQGKTVAWKSNPYLTSKFTGESDSLHLQWVVIDLKKEQPVSAVQIAWSNPYATSYQIEHWTGNDALDFDAGPKGDWKTFPSGEFRNAKGGAVTFKPAGNPVTTRFIRVLMTESSNTCDGHGSSDIRNCVGYAIQEIHAGTLDATGAFVDAAQGATGRAAPSYTASSIDPWHQAADINTTGSYQHTGFDLFFTSGLTNNLPAMIPVTMLYGTPDDAAAQIAYIEKRGYPISYIEMGEEPDGKHAMPEDYAALYIQWANALHKVDPNLKLGGPIFEGVNEDIRVWPDAQGRTSWLGRFVAYLKDHGHLNDLAFVSFEHYPFAPCEVSWKDLYREPQLMKGIIQVWRDDGVPRDVPQMVTENHLSWQLTGPMTTIFAALWLADNVGSFFEGGGAAFYHSPIQPQTVNQTCQGWSSWSNFVSNENYEIKGYTSPYYAARMINLEWVQHRSGVHQMFPAATDLKDADGNLLITAYAVHRPDGNWSLMLVNRDENNPHTIRVSFENAKEKRNQSFTGSVAWTSFGSDQYVWINDGPNSHPDPNLPPAAKSITDANAQTIFTLPKASITVLRGKLSN